MHTERRRSPRHPFLASADITDEKENIRSASKVSDLSLEGCYVEMADPFPPGANVTIEIYTDDDFLESHATVVRYEPKTGMGLSFHEMQPHFAGILKKWLGKEVTRPA